VVRGGFRYAAPRSYIVGRSAFYRPYYSFRPRLNLGFGLWVGYPVSYPYYYDYPYGYAYPYTPDPYAYAAPTYGYPATPYPPASPSSVYPRPSPSYPPDYQDYGSPAPEYSTSQPAPRTYDQRDGQGAPGGVSFEITPDTAAVFVDGTFVGTAGAFGPRNQPLGLISGRHHIEIRASGYRTMTFDADVQSGQVIPFQGTLQRN